MTAATEDTFVDLLCRIPNSGPQRAACALDRLIGSR